MKTNLTLPNSLDPAHKFVFRSGEFGMLYSYWYVDQAGNYFKYSNAPIESTNHDPFGGDPMLDPEQKFPHTDPEYFTPDGFRRNMAPPPEAKPLPNAEYSPDDLNNIFNEYYLAPEGDSIRYIYLDKDCKENIDLYIQQQIRLVDAGLVKYRKFASEKFQSQHPRNKSVGCMLMLADQAYFSVDELITAKVGDLELVDDTVILLGRKFKVDAALLDYLSERIIGRSIDDYLFTQETYVGDEPFGPASISSFFNYLKVSCVFLPYWHATHLYSKIVNKYSLLGIAQEEVDVRALLELSRVLNTTEDVKYLVDPQVRNTLSRIYTTQSNLQKSIKVSQSDSFGVAQVFSDLVDRTGDELSFSTWLHSQSLHSEFEGSEAERESELIQIDDENNMMPEDIEKEQAEEEISSTSSDPIPDESEGQVV
jgi:hypothetical protein